MCTERVQELATNHKTSSELVISTELDSEGISKSIIYSWC